MYIFELSRFPPWGDSHDCENHDAQVAPGAACIAVHYADPVGGAQKVTEKACVAVRI